MVFVLAVHFYACHGLQDIVLYLSKLMQWRSIWIHDGTELSLVINLTFAYGRKKVRQLRGNRRNLWCRVSLPMEKGFLWSLFSIPIESQRDFGQGLQLFVSLYLQDLPDTICQHDNACPYIDYKATFRKRCDLRPLQEYWDFCKKCLPLYRRLYYTGWHK